MTEQTPEIKFNYFLETVNNGSTDQPEDLMGYIFESGFIVRGRPVFGVVPDEFKGRQALWVTRDEDEFVCVAPAKVEGDQVVWEKNNLVTPFRPFTVQRLKPLIDQVPERIPLAKVTIPESKNHPDKV